MWRKKLKCTKWIGLVSAIIIVLAYQNCSMTTLPLAGFISPYSSVKVPSNGLTQKTISAGIDSISISGIVTGWTSSTTSQNEPINLIFVFDKNPNSSIPIPANIFSPNGTQGFQFQIPANFIDGKGHSISATATDSARGYQIINLPEVAQNFNIAPKVSINSFQASSTSLTSGDILNLSWSTANAESVTMTPATYEMTKSGNPVLPSSGSERFNIMVSTQYTLIAKGADGSQVTATVSISVVPLASLSINSFQASSTSLTSGDILTLSWSTANAESVTMTPATYEMTKSGNPVLPSSGSESFQIMDSMQYMLIVKGQNGSQVTSTIAIDVKPAPASCRIGKFPFTSNYKVGETITIDVSIYNAPAGRLTACLYGTVTAHGQTIYDASCAYPGPMPYSKDITFGRGSEGFYTRSAKVFDGNGNEICTSRGDLAITVQP